VVTLVPFAARGVGVNCISRSKASKCGQAPVKTTFRILASLLLLTIGYECMVGAFHLLNLPSDRAVYEGTAVLLLLVVFLPLVLVRLWRSS
jgi:hypothetical protein